MVPGEYGFSFSFGSTTFDLTNCLTTDYQQFSYLLPSSGLDVVLFNSYNIPDFNFLENIVVQANTNAVNNGGSCSINVCPSTLWLLLEEV